MRAAEGVKTWGCPQTRARSLLQCRGRTLNVRTRTIYALPRPGAPFLGLCTWERISLLLRWLFSSEKICESFLKVDNGSLWGTGEGSGVGGREGQGRDWVGRRSRPSSSPHSCSPAHRAPAALEPIYGVRLQGRQDGAQGGEVPQFPAALGGGGAGQTPSQPGIILLPGSQDCGPHT